MNFTSLLLHGRRSLFNGEPVENGHPQESGCWSYKEVHSNPTSLFQVIRVIFVSYTSIVMPLYLSSLINSFVSPSLNYFFIVLLGRQNKPGSHVFAYTLTASNTKRTNLTWLPLEIIHRGHTWHDYPWPWVSLTWLLYNCPRRWFRKFTVRFRPIRKEIVSWMYSNSVCHLWYPGCQRLL